MPGSKARTRTRRPRGKYTMMYDPSENPSVKTLKIKQHDKKVARIAKRVVISKLEHKYRDFNINAGFTLDSSTNAQIVSISDVPQSAGASSDITRIGDQITPTSTEVTMLIKAPANDSMAGTIESAVVRCIVFRWHPLVVAGTSFPVLADIFTQTAVFGAALGPLNHDKRNLFNVLYDRTITVYNTRPAVPIKVMIPLKPKPIKFIAGSTTDASEKLFFVLISDLPVGNASGDKAQCAYYAVRLNFLDG